MCKLHARSVQDPLTSPNAVVNQKLSAYLHMWPHILELSINQYSHQMLFEGIFCHEHLTQTCLHQLLIMPSTAVIFPSRNSLIDVFVPANLRQDRYVNMSLLSVA